MRFVAFEFENFKGIARLHLDLLPESGDDRSRIVTLVGLNESGKTTILEALDYFVAGQDSDEIRPKHVLGVRKPEPHEIIPIAKRANFNESITLTAILLLDDDDKLAIKRQVERETGFRIKELDEKISVSNVYYYENSRLKKSSTAWSGGIGAGTTARGRTLKTLGSRSTPSEWKATINAIRERVPSVWYFPDFLFEFPERVILTEHPNEPLANQLFRSLFQDVLDCISPGMTVDEHIVDRALSSNPADKAALSQLRMDIGAEVTRSVVSEWNALFRNSDMRDKRVYVEFETEIAEDGATDVIATVQLEDQGQLFSVRERSLGFRWFFVYLLLTTYRSARSGRGIVFLFDEPASNLHSSAQSLLLESLRKLSREAQIVFTTHSPHLVSPELLESTYVVANAAVDPTSISSAPNSRGTNISLDRYAAFANQHPTKTHYFQPVLDVLEYQPSRLELTPSAVMVEGKSDYYLLRYFELFPGQDGGITELALVPGTGSGSLDLPIRLYLGWARRFLVLLDNDQGGRDATRHYEAEFGRIVSSKIVEVASASGQEQATDLASLLTDEDRMKFVKLANGRANSYSKRPYGLGLEHAVAGRIDLGLSPESSEALRTVHEYIHTRLQED